MRSRTIGNDLTAALVAAGLSLMLAPAAFAHGSSGHAPPIKIGTLKIKKQGYFYTAGEYADPVEKDHMVGQMYVEYQIPENVTSKYPIIMVHGGSQLGVNFTGTPDDRPGWRDYFLSRGWPVYVVDQVARGRSPYTAEYGPRGTYTAKSREDAFTAIEIANNWPESQLHTQWPGTGLRGDPTFDQFMMQQDPGMAQNRGPQEILTDRGLVALLDKIGPAVIMTHSQSGVDGWQVLDQRPSMVKALVSVEPYGPPFYNEDNVTLGRPWGITNTPLQFSPSISDPSEFELEQQADPSFPGALRCWLQKEPAKYTLPSMASSGAPILIVTAEASSRSRSDHCTELFLEQAGVGNIEHTKLETVGIHGNGHMMMLEKNNLEIAAYMEGWLSKKLSKHAHGPDYWPGPWPGPWPGHWPGYHGHHF
jgi:pimeloyl-ACP methyl ester carboxylesterase